MLLLITTVEATATRMSGMVLKYLRARKRKEWWELR
jgi:hypothetical protein